MDSPATGSDYDAVVVGGGPAGCTVAIRLAEAGWSVALVEQKRFPRRKVCGECISATNLDVFDALGIGAAFAAEAGPALRRVAFMCGDRTSIGSLPRLTDTRHPFGRALGREHLDALLLGRAVQCGVKIWQPWTMRRTGCLDASNRRPVEIRSGSGAVQMLTARVVIAAHGSWGKDPFPSPSRPHRPMASDLYAFKATFAGSSLEPGLLPVLAFAGGYGGMVIGDRGQLTLAFCIRRDALRKARRQNPEMPAAEAAQALVLAECRGARHALLGTARSAAWLAAGVIRPGVRAPFSDAGIFAVGNAAGEAHPILGEGISMAVQGGWLLAESLASHRCDRLRDEALKEIGRRYEAQWRKCFAPRIRVAALFAHLVMRHRSAALLSAIVGQWPGLLATSARWGYKVRRSVNVAGSGIHDR